MKAFVKCTVSLMLATLILAQDPNTQPATGDPVDTSDPAPIDSGQDDQTNPNPDDGGVTGGEGVVTDDAN